MTPEQELNRRLVIEQVIIHALVGVILTHGYKITVDFGDGVNAAVQPVDSDDFSEIWLALQTVDEETLCVMKNGKRVGDILLVYGNDGYDVIADYSDNQLINGFVDAVEGLSDYFQDVVHGDITAAGVRHG